MASSVINVSSNNFFVFSSHSIEPHRCNFLSLPFLILPRKQRRSLGSLGSSVLLFQRSSCSGSAQRKRRSNKVGWEGEGDSALEGEIWLFMQNSDNPSVFPSKKAFIDGGRKDLVDRIVKQGGWLSIGWNLDEDETVQDNGVGVFELNSRNEYGIDDGLLSIERFDDGSSVGGVNGSSVGGVEICDLGVSSSPSPSPHPSTPSSSGRWMDDKAGTGIEGILSRLEKQRNQSLGLDSREKLTNDDRDDIYLRISEGNGNETSDLLYDSGGVSLQCGSLSDTADTWRNFSMQRAHLSEMKFKAAKNGGNIATDDEMVPKVVTEPRNVRREPNSGDKDKDPNDIKSRLQDMRLELSSLLHRIRSSKINLAVSYKDKANSTEEFHTVSDMWELQETDIMNARTKLRSLRAQMAILEGKLALANMEARTTVEVKQKRISYAQKALGLLQTVCIVWPNPALEVFLVGSFDGWTSQRRMERSSYDGVFHLTLKLYPGRYEFKFIVDGSWMIDPLRPVVHSNGFQNNLLIISDKS